MNLSKAEASGTPNKRVEIRILVQFLKQNPTHPLEKSEKYREHD